jgi:hypothetical protein
MSDTATQTSGLVPNASIIDQDVLINKLITDFSKNNSDYWTFKNIKTVEDPQTYMQYPAMMVPELQGKIMDTLLVADPNIRHIYDPFMGSGIIMTQAILRGLDFRGIDINPLAALICRAKMGPFNCDKMDEKGTHVQLNAALDRSRCYQAEFPGLNKWFHKDAIIELSKLRRAIRLESDLWARRFFWVTLGETVRLTSNSRTSTFKLHVRSKEDLDKNHRSPFKVFDDVLFKNLSKLRSFQKSLTSAGRLLENNYQGKIELILGDSSSENYRPQSADVDVLMTSPPYGDNRTTVPYGQFSYLPLQWIDGQDIDPSYDSAILKSTCQIDSMSLGGSLKDIDNKATFLQGISPTLDKVVSELKDAPKDKLAKVVGFCHDFYRAVDNFMYQMKPNTLLVWTLGNRNVHHMVIPFDEIVQDILCAKGCRLISKFERSIYSKRMAPRNGTSKTICKETILIFRYLSNGQNS